MMCINHGEAHYPRRLQDAAALFVGGDDQDKWLFLQACTLEGMLRICEQNATTIPTSALLPIMNQLKRFNREVNEEIEASRVRVFERWEAIDESALNLDEIPY